MICLDANILIEIIVSRKSADACRQYIVNASEDLATTLLSVDLAMYYVEANKLDTGPVEQFLRQLIWLPLTETDAEWAFKHFAGKDFEDGLQIGCARREKCSRFVTLDKALAKKYAELMPVDLLSQND